MKKPIIWDLSIRILHAAFGLSLTLALLIGFTVDDDAPLFAWHMLFGLIASGLILIRLLVSLIGSRHAKWKGFLFTPWETIRYMVLAPFGKASRYAGHNPGSALAALGMFAAAAGLVLTGLFMGSEAGEEIHEGLAIFLVVMICIYLGGLLLHTIHHREPIALSMITGRKEAPANEGIGSSGIGSGIATLTAVILLIGALFRGYDPRSHTVHVPLAGSLQLPAGDSDHGSAGDDHGYEDDDD